LTQNPILTVLFTLRKRRVKCLLIGGQACIIYGAAEFSRDSDFVILNDPANLQRSRKALRDLEAERIYVPALAVKYLAKGIESSRMRRLQLRASVRERVRGKLALSS